MIQIIPELKEQFFCPSCKDSQLVHQALIWQGVHICSEGLCSKCSETFLSDLPVGQAILERYQLRKSDKKLFGSFPYKWLIQSLTNITDNPIKDSIDFKVEVLEKSNEEVIVLNTLDNCYGHSLLYFLNLSNIISKRGDKSIVIIIQPFLRWLIPSNGISEVWTVNLSLPELKMYYTDVTDKINKELKKFRKVFLSNAYLSPKPVCIESFTKIKPYDFQKVNQKPRITFIWREDKTRLWIRNWLIYGFLRKLNFSSVLLPFHYLKVFIFFTFLKIKLKGMSYEFTLAGLGKYGWFPSFVQDLRVTSFNRQAEIDLCRAYAESKLVIGVHGSSMILPSAHAGMTVSIMPAKRWGNFSEDILYTENDMRLAAFQKRIIPMRISLFELVDICLNMLNGREYFLKKITSNASDL